MAADAGSAGKLYYVYAMTRGGLPRRFVVAGRNLRTVDVEGVSLVVETMTAAPEATEQTLREQHAVVVELSGRVDALLPARFGALFTPDELDARIKSAHDVIRDALERVSGRVQMTVRVHAEPITVADSSLSTGTAYLAARSERERALRRHAVRIRRVVSPYVVEERLDAGKGALLGTVYHLIKAADADRYRGAIEKAAPSFAPARLTVTGPWPVFAFAPELGQG